MELKPCKIYYVRINKKRINFSALRTAAEKVRNKPIQVCYDGSYFKIIDKRLKQFQCFERYYYPERFIIEKQNMQLELDF